MQADLFHRKTKADRRPSRLLSIAKTKTAEGRVASLLVDRENGRVLRIIFVFVRALALGLPWPSRIGPGEPRAPPATERLQTPGPGCAYQKCRTCYAD